jgi:serine/threonine-protein kinase RsbW
MSETKGEVLYYGIDNISEKLDGIIQSLNLKKQCFEIKLIIIEAVNNAFIHGNKKDKNKSIYIRWQFEENLLEVSVTDCGEGVENLANYNFENDDILAESGRGLQIINCYSDSVEFEGNSIIMKKYLA